MIKTRGLINFVAMVAKSSFIPAVALLIMSSFAFAQRVIPGDSLRLGEWILSSSEDSTTICVAYSIPFSRVIFTKAPGGGHFTSNLSFSLDATDSLTTATYHGYDTRKTSLPDYRATRSALRFCEDYLTLKVPMSRYSFNVEVRDNSQQITYLNRSFVERLDSNRSAPGFQSVVFLDSASGEKLFPVVENNVAPFPYPLDIVLVMKDSATSKIALSLTTKDGQSVYHVDSLVPFKARLEPDDSMGVFYFHETSDPGYSLYHVVIRVDSLREGLYELLTSVRGTNNAMTFSYAWLDEPSTLHNFMVAVQLLKYIVPDSVYSQINSGNETETKEHFDSYWREHDPTPNTAFNELEAEFYERADYAFAHFSTLVDRNGADTERGKAYILFGEPARIKREFRKDGTYEMWYYPNLKRCLVFKEQGYGNFKLYQTEKL